jgi:hypothetical protein
VKKGKWTAEEDETLIDAHKRHGNSWTEIAMHLPSRLADNAKNN